MAPRSPEEFQGAPSPPTGRIWRPFGALLAPFEVDFANNFGSTSYAHSWAGPLFSVDCLLCVQGLEIMRIARSGCNEGKERLKKVGRKGKRCNVG